jgi:RHS repeat-associated protein
VTKTVGTTTTTFVYDASGQLAAEYNGPTIPGKTLYLTADHLGSTRLVTSGTTSPTVEEQFDYAPFGEELTQGVSGRGSPYSNNQYPTATQDVVTEKFTSKERDAETGLDFFGARYMSSAQGRFTSADPLGGGAGREEDPQSWNLYAYARNNPLTYVDPLGLNYTVCDADGKNCRDLTDKQYADYRKSSPSIYQSPGGTLYARNDSGPDTKVGSAQYYNERAENAAAFLNFSVTTLGPNYLMVAGPLFQSFRAGTAATSLFGKGPFRLLTNGQLNKAISAVQRQLLRNWWGEGSQGALNGARQALENFRVPEGVEREPLELYKEAAERVVQRGPGAPGYEVQKVRLELVNKALQDVK